MKRALGFEVENLTKKVSLVNRSDEPCGIQLVNSAAVGKRAPNDLVELAIEIQKADNFIHANACNKLQIIADQIRFLQQQAENVLRETKLNLDLHHAACNFVKVPGNVYHLYKRPSGQEYFSMLSPQEWTNSPHSHLGSFRLEHDQSWTPIEAINQKDVELTLINKILAQGEHSINMLSLQSSPH
ncbi:hypothetical protein RI129_004932 [Pyrocoelia pectoralis]|uniref:DUF2452 domain-containing protein n=1 Tax=Pyrocoelia pectoralis TaxID=417401 RepID=A0AAN7VIM1_9COLE